MECTPAYFQVLLFRGENAPHCTVSVQHCKTTGLYNHVIVITITFLTASKAFIILPYIYMQPVVWFSCLLGTKSATEKALWCLCFQRCCFNIAQRRLFASAKVGRIKSGICTPINVLHKHINMSRMKMGERTFRS